VQSGVAGVCDVVERVAPLLAERRDHREDARDKALPSALQVPKLPWRQMAACPSERSATLFAGSTPGSCTKVKRA
jgi:hypothetical protein